MGELVWIFGYGSIIWRPAFAYVAREPGWIEGYVRRFWQGSPDHRGVPHAPGRVVTLVEEAGARCEGLLFGVGPGDADAILEQLDRRESGGFERLQVEAVRRGGGLVPAIVYLAPRGNPNFLGPAPLDAMADQIGRAVGQSGSNREYLERLAHALEVLDIADAHVEGLLARVHGG